MGYKTKTRVKKCVGYNESRTQRFLLIYAISGNSMQKKAHYGPFVSSSAAVRPIYDMFY